MRCGTTKVARAADTRSIVCPAKVRTTRETIRITSETIQNVTLKICPWVASKVGCGVGQRRRPELLTPAPSSVQPGCEADLGFRVPG